MQSTIVRSHLRPLLQSRGNLLRSYVVRPIKSVATTTTVGKSRFLSFLAGGTGFGTGVAVSYRHMLVRCHAADRISASVRVLRKEDGKFDWWRFWTYLRPHIIKFLGAICVSYLIKFRSISIPIILYISGSIGRCLFQHQNTSITRRFCELSGAIRSNRSRCRDIHSLEILVRHEGARC